MPKKTSAEKWVDEPLKGTKTCISERGSNSISPLTGSRFLKREVAVVVVVRGGRGKVVGGDNLMWQSSIPLELPG